MGQVYRARQESMDRDVAIKLIVDRAANIEEFAIRFEREVKLCASLNHAHIIKVFDYGRSKNQAAAYLVMEYLKGGNLANLIRKKHSLPLETVAKLLEQMASALDYAHQKGIVHRDLKPLNVLLDEAGNAYLSDFGLAKLRSASTLTQTGTTMGTAAYMSPEQWKGNPTLDHRADIYALGIMLFEMLTRCVPFEADSAALMYMHLEKPIPAVRSFRPNLPLDVQAVLEKATAKIREKRFQSANALSMAFREAIRTSTSQYSNSRSIQTSNSFSLSSMKSNTPLPKRSKITAANIENLHCLYSLNCGDDESGITAVQFAPDSETVLVACGDYIIWYDLKMKHEIRRINAFPECANRSVRYNPLCFIAEVGFSSDSTFAACVVNKYVDEEPNTTGNPNCEITKNVQLWNLKTGKCVISAPMNWRFEPKFAFSPDGSLFAASDRSTTVTLWETRSGLKRHEFYHPMTDTIRQTFDYLSRPVFTSDNSTLIVGHVDDTENIVGTINIWDIRSGRKLGVWQGESAGPMRFPTFTPLENQLLAIDNYATGWLWDFPSGEVRQVFVNSDFHTHGVGDFYFTRSGNYMAIESGILDLKHPLELEREYLITVWKLTPPTRVKLEVVCRPKEPRIIHLSDDGSLLLIHTDYNGTLVAYNVTTPQHLGEIPAQCPAMSPDETLLAFGNRETHNTLEVWGV